MEKYGAEIARYEVIQVIPMQPDDKKVLGSNLTFEEAQELAKEHKDAMIVPM